MSAAAVQVADDVAAELNVSTNGPGGPWSQTFSAERAWFPVVQIGPDGDAEQITSSAVCRVIPDSTPLNESGTRGLVTESQVLMAVLQVKVADKTNATVDPWVLLLESIKDWFAHPKYRHKVGSLNAVCLAVAVESYCFRPHLEKLFVYTGALSLTFTVYR